MVRDSGWTAKKTCAYYRVGRKSLRRWLRRFDGTRESLADLAAQGARRIKRYNDAPREVLGCKPPNQVEVEKLSRLLHDTDEVRCPKLAKRLTSSES